MDVREKLVELIVNASHECDDFYDLWDMRQAADCIADFLIAHGVTVQEWISVKDRLPEDMVDVLTCDAKGNIHIMWHHHEYQYPFNIGRNDIRYFPVTHWGYLPQPPKGE